MHLDIEHYGFFHKEIHSKSLKPYHIEIWLHQSWFRVSTV